MQNALGKANAFFITLLLISMMAVQFIAAATPAQAQTAPPAFPPCTSDMYLAQNIPTQLFRAATTTNPFTYPAVGSAHSTEYNAIAYNSADNYIYALNRPSGQQTQLLRVGSNGAVQQMGAVTGGTINARTPFPNGGEIGSDGFYYVKRNSDNVLYRIDLATRIATDIPLTDVNGASITLNSADLAWHQGRLYSHNSANNQYFNQFYSIEVTGANAGRVTLIGNSGTTGQYGGLVSASNGVFGFNNSGGFFQFNLTTGEATRISNSPISSNNDAAKCISTPLQFGADLSITKTDNSNFYVPGTSRTYSVVVTNNGPFGALGALVNDPLPAGITSASWTCGNETLGGSCGAASGTGAIADQRVDLPNGATATYTVTLNIPASFTGALTNVATVTPPSTIIDSNTSNNTATDVNAGVTVAKQLLAETGSVANVAEAGEQLTYRITLTNPTNVAVTGVAVLDRIDVNTSFVSATNGGAIVGRDVTWNNLSIPANGTATVDVVVRVADPLPAGVTQVTNIARPVGAADPACPSAACVVTPTKSAVTYEKSTTATDAVVGDDIAYTLNVTVANSPTTGVLTLTDTLGAGLDFGAVTDAGAFTCNAANPLVCTLPTGTAVGTYPLTYSAKVNATATGTVVNTVVGSGVDAPTCGAACNTSTPIVTPDVGYSKTTSAVGPVKAGETISYTLTTTISNSLITSDIVLLSDSLGAGIDFTAVTSNNGYLVDTSAAPNVAFRLPATTGPGVYSVTYTATVNGQASGTVNNIVVGSGADNPRCVGACETATTVEAAAVTYSKSVTPPAATVKVGEVLPYTLTVNVADAATSGIVTLTDTLGTGLDFTAVTDAGDFTCNAANPLVCTLPAGRAVGSYSLTYTATVNNAAVGTVDNAVVGTGSDAPTCAGNCETSTPVEASAVTYAKSVTAPSAAVSTGDVLNYSLTATVTNAPTTGEVTLTDTLGTGLDFGSVTDAGVFTCNAANPLVCTLPAKTPVGTYMLTYSASVNADAAVAVDNVVVGSGVDNPTCADNCTTSTPVAAPVVSVTKSADPTNGETVEIGQTIRYGLVATVSNSATTAPLVLLDTPDAGLTITSLPAGCVRNGSTITCTLDAGLPVGTHPIFYEATVNQYAGDTVRNTVTAAGGGGVSEPSCVACVVEHKIELPMIRLVKTAAVREAKIGDLVRYTLTVENIGARAFVNGSVIDTPPAGFTYVEGSLQVADKDGVASVLGQRPLRFEGVDVDAGESATLVYLMRVGAGVRQGTHINRAQAYSSDNQPVSNQATAQVELVGDPLVDETLIFGTVFDDRDGDGWQDSAAVSVLRVQGGYAADALVAGSTQTLRGSALSVDSDSKADLLRGIKLGSIAARQSQADEPVNNQIVIRQRLTALTFTDDFTLTNGQGVTVRMNAAGETRVEKSGDAAKGLNGAEPTVERRVASDANGYIVDYIIQNAGIDERGIPGVRIASVEGLIMETDQFGRYHLEGIPGGAWERGRNFILKVDPATVPSGSVFSTDNPLLRRITPGIPVRFDWGVKLPTVLIEGRTKNVELELGKVMFAPASADLRTAYQPVIDRMAAKITEYRGGTVVIDATGETEALAFARADAVKSALMTVLDAETGRNVTVEARAVVNDPATMITGLNAGGGMLGTILFATDASDIKPEFAPLLDRIAAWLNAKGGGTISIVGHTDLRGSFDYNQALGMRRAKSVSDALASRLTADIRAKVQVVSIDGSATPAAEQGQ